MGRLTFKTASFVVPALIALSLIGGLAAPAQASFGVAPGSFQTDVLDPAGNVVPTPQAGAHPFAYRLAFAMNTKPNPFPEGGLFGNGPEPIPDDSVKDVRIELPPGIAGKAQSFPRCSAVDFTPAGFGGSARCPTGSQIGIVELDLGFVDGYHSVNKLPIYNLVPPKGVVARIGFVAIQPIVTDFKLRSGGDYGVTAIARNISQGVNLYASAMNLWGVPADPRHDAERYLPGAFVPGDSSGNPLPSGMVPAPFLDMPTRCGVGLTTRMEVDSWEEPGSFQSYESPPDEWGGCDRLRFAPSVAVQPQEARAGSPAGFGVRIEVPQSDNPDGMIAPPLQKAVVTLPEGVTINASSAAGLAGCSPAEIALGSEAAPNCPRSSKLAAVRIETPLLDHTLEGSVYLASQNANPFNSLLALYLVAVDPETGVTIKLPGKVTADPATGRLSTTFDETPQLPFETLQIQFRRGSGAPLLMPDACGTYTTHAQLSSWADPGQSVLSDPTFVLDRGCDRHSRFAPTLDAGTANPLAGATSSFALRVLRDDGEQNLSRIDVTLPEGLLAKLAGVPLCGEAAAGGGNCPAASEIGRAVVGVGAGPNPLYLPQPGKASTAVFLAGPYKGAPYSLVIEVPAQAGPFDLGTVAVRSAVQVDPLTTEVAVASDPLPQILEGIPVAYRDVRVEVDRPGFIRNPTGCEPMKIRSRLVSTEGATASPSARFQVTNCRALAFSPRLRLEVSGGTRRSTFPALRATLRARAGEANIARVAVTLPPSESLEQAHIRTICTRVQYAADQCPKASIYGYAKAWSPLLDEPLQGPVYLRSSNHLLPDLVASLDGQIHIDLVGRIDSVGGGIRTTFARVPDAAVSKFALRMKGGERGLLVNNRNLCAGPNRATVSIDGQNGKSADRRPLVGNDC